MAQLFCFIRHSTPPPGAQSSQLMFGWPKKPWLPPQLQRLAAYSSGAPKT
jgi:hypothetical protein